MKNFTQFLVSLSLFFNFAHGQAMEDQALKTMQTGLLQLFEMKKQFINLIIPLHAFKIETSEILESKIFQDLSYQAYIHEKLEDRKNEIQKAQNMKKALLNQLNSPNFQKIYRPYRMKHRARNARILPMVRYAINEIIDFSINPSMEILIEQGFNQSQSRLIISIFDELYGSLDTPFYEIPKFHFESKKEFIKNKKLKYQEILEVIDQKFNEEIELLNEHSTLVIDTVLSLSTEEFQKICHHLLFFHNYPKNISLEFFHIQNWYNHIMDIISKARKNIVNGNIDQANFRYTTSVVNGFYSNPSFIPEEVYSQKNPYFWLLDEMIQFLLFKESAHISECLKILLQNSVYIPLANLELVQEMLCTIWIEQAIIENKLESLTRIFLDSDTVWGKEYNAVFKKIESHLKVKIK